MTTNVGRRRLLVVGAHAADFVWRAGGVIAKHTAAGWEATVVALSYGERGESGELWREEGQTVGRVKQIRDAEARAAAEAVGATFGVGHMVGLGIRDAGPASDETRDRVPGLPRLRVDIPLAPRHAWTVEPGVYVVPALLASAHGRDQVVWERVDRLRGFGGVRLEQNVLIGADGCEVLTAAIPLAPV